MSRDWRLRVADVVEYADDALAFVAGMTYEEFAADLRTQRAVVYSLLIVGEASKHVPEEVRLRDPDAGWRGAAGFRDLAAHGYDALKLRRVWDILHGPLPILRAHAAAIVAELDGTAGRGS